jgi:alkanesulfonate monooxygenase SsuD/methylene tetrahydromethanopterin reductase-like flavin-dependent oxidoreductase (luciferase family)
MTQQPRIGVMFLREYDPVLIPAFAEIVESAGLDDLWIIEDAFFNGGLSGAAVALASTQRISVGIGIQPAVVRNAAYNTMDLATLARIYPGRLEIGFGHGVADWMRQVGAFPTSQVGALEQVTLATRRLLRGETVSIDTPDVYLDRVALVYPPQVVPLVSLGVTGPKSLEMSGRAADGTIMVELTSPELVRENRICIAEGQREANRSGEHHQVTVFTHWVQSDAAIAARASLKPMVAERIAGGGMRQMVAPGYAPEAERLLAAGGIDHLAREMPDEWIANLAVTGSVKDCLHAIDRFAEAGAHRVCLVPPIGTPLDEIGRWSRELMTARNGR